MKLQDPRRSPLPLGRPKRGGVPCVLARNGVDAAALLLEESLVFAADADSEAERGRQGASARAAEGRPAAATSPVASLCDAARYCGRHPAEDTRKPHFGGRSTTYSCEDLDAGFGERGNRTTSEYANCPQFTILHRNRLPEHVRRIGRPLGKRSGIDESRERIVVVRFAT